MWESNPPRAFLERVAGFEVQKAHQNLSTPVYRDFQYTTHVRCCQKLGQAFIGLILPQLLLCASVQE